MNCPKCNSEGKHLYELQYSCCNSKCQAIFESMTVTGDRRKGKYEVAILLDWSDEYDTIFQTKITKIIDNALYEHKIGDIVYVVLAKEGDVDGYIDPQADPKYEV